MGQEGGYFAAALFPIAEIDSMDLETQCKMQAGRGSAEDIWRSIRYLLLAISISNAARISTDYFQHSVGALAWRKN